MRYLAIIFAMFASAVSTGENHNHSVMATDVRVAASIGMARTGAGYLTVMNHSEMDDTLLRIEADFPRVEIHNIEVTDGVTSMVRQDDGVLVPAGGMVALAPGGMHVMFMGLAAPFIAGETVDATLIFEHAGEISVVFEIVERDLIGGESDHTGHGHDDGSN